ncbi:hypothetical protein RhiirA1_483804 [Rhizophagus irregularis]|uniref:PH domain-containing protein n=1 Tax=Rhizophagus irregularis TaxID=588596 RepID=A0A2N0QK23_9GLOM|nr:hypothetical protein RhiirA1_483804 [Rhizophagus irregularis]
MDLLSESEQAKQQIEDWIKTLPSTVYRIKGYIPVEGVKNPMLFQYAYGLVQWLPEYIKMPAKVVIIGENVDEVKATCNGVFKHR